MFAHVESVLYTVLQQRCVPINAAHGSHIDCRMCSHIESNVFFTVRPYQCCTWLGMCAHVESVLYSAAATVRPYQCCTWLGGKGRVDGSPKSTVTDFACRDGMCVCVCVCVCMTYACMYVCIYIYIYILYIYIYLYIICIL